MSITEKVLKLRKPRAAAAPAEKAVRAPAVRRRTQTERSDEMRMRLVEASAIVLRRKGYAGLRTDEVARVAKVSRGALQHHFPSKDSLVVATAEHLLQASLMRGQRRAGTAEAVEDPIAAIIEDGLEFFLGADFTVVLDLVLAGSKSRAMRDRIYEHARTNRLGVEDAWLALLIAKGVPPDKAEKVLWLTISVIRGFAVRALWQQDDALFRSLLDEWKLIIVGHLQALKNTSDNKKSTASGARR